MKSILITGANRGIGFGVVNELVTNLSSVELIFAGYRDASRSKVIFIKIKIRFKNICIILP
jgi:NAD(P)-dependent dehydrogenase (short-subunit alcohol dehydrogenase family)